MKYSTASDEGLGLSLVVYAAAMIFGLFLIIAPVLWANGAMVYDNPGARAETAKLNSALYGPPRDRKEFPLAVLKRPDIVSPDMLAALNAKSEKTAKKVASGERSRSVGRAAHSAYAQAPQQYDEEPPRRGFLFGLF